MIEYWYLVGSEADPRDYDGNDAADAMAAFTKAVLDGDEYVTLEAVRERKQ